MKNISIVKAVEEKGPVEKTSVSVKVLWKSKSRERLLPDHLVQVGSMLFRGISKQLAFAVWRNASLRPHIIEAFCKEIERECVQYCLLTNSKPRDSLRAARILKNSPAKLKKNQADELPSSCIRLTGIEDILKFTFDKFFEELKTKMPLSKSVLMTMCWRRSKRKKDDLFFTPGVCMAAAVYLKNRSRNMTAFQLILSLMMQLPGELSIVI